MDFLGAPSHGIGIGAITSLYYVEKKVSSWKGEIWDKYDLSVKMQLKLHPTHPT